MNSNPYILSDAIDENFFNPIFSLFFGFSVMILLCTLILSMPQLQAQKLKTSQSWSSIKYLIPPH